MLSFDAQVRSDCPSLTLFLIGILKVFHKKENKMGCFPVGSGEKCLVVNINQTNQLLYLKFF